VFNKVIATLLIFIFPVSVFAEGRVVRIKKGEMAIFDGSLMDDEAVASIITDKNNQEKKCKLEIDYLTMRQKSECELENGKTKIDLSISQRKLEEITKIKNDEINRLREIASKNPNSNSILWMSLGVAGGILLSLGTFFAVSRIK